MTLETSLSTFTNTPPTITACSTWRATSTSGSWTCTVPLSIQDNNEFRPFRGNVYQTKRLDAEGKPVDKYDYVVYNIQGVKEFLETYEKAKATDI